VKAAKAAYKEWRRVPPLERARMLKKIAEVLRNNAGELAMIDSADCGNPISEMIMDATIAAAQIEFFAGLVTAIDAQVGTGWPRRLDLELGLDIGIAGARIRRPAPDSEQELRAAAAGLRLCCWQPG
jgi:betaine-aldehyde dehydrogenase